jgi:LCP family protein required for cell wall assembly
MVTLGVVLMAFSAVTLLTGRYLLTRYAKSLHLENLLGDARAGGSSIDGPVNVLLVGLDERPGEKPDGVRADSVIIVHLPADHQQAYLVPVPRDALATIPAYPKSGYPGGREKVNAAFEHGSQGGGGRAGGFELLAMTVRQLTGASFNGAAIVNFGGFQSLVTALGGVDLCVDETVVSIHVGTDANGRFHPPYEMTDDGPVPIPGTTPQVYRPGCQHMTAWQALDYVRQRELLPDGDYGRQRHQLQFLRAVLKQASRSRVLSNPVRLDAVLRTAGPALTFDGGGVPIGSWLFTFRNIRVDRTVLLKTNGGVFNTAEVDGQQVELLTNLSLTLFQQLRRDAVDEFVAAHRDWVASPFP